MVGPTLAFKDLGLQFIGGLLNYYVAQENRHINILVSTSGDTGSAAIHAVRGKSNVDIFVLYPKGRITRFQEMQLITVLDPNVHVVEVEGTSDEADVPVRNLFADAAFKRICFIAY